MSRPFTLLLTRLRTAFLALALLFCQGAGAQDSQVINAIASTGATTNTVFTFGMTVTGSNQSVADAETGDTVVISTAITPDAADLGANVDIYVVTAYTDGITMRNVDGNYLSWNLDPASLVPFRENVALTDGLEVEIYAGGLASTGKFRTFVGYMKSGTSTLVYSRKAGKFTVSQSTESAPFYTPAPVVELLQLSRSVTWPTLDNTPADLQRFTMGPADSDDIVVLTDADGEAGLALTLAEGLENQGSVSDDLLLRSMFKFIAEDDGGFRIASTKHSNYALDMDESSGDLVLRDIRSGALVADEAAYLVFSIIGTNDNAILQATGRKLYDAGQDDYVSDISWSDREVSLAGATLFLSNSAGTAMTLYSPPIDFDIPFDFNPLGTARVDNAEIDPIVKHTGDPLADARSQVLPAYAPQVTAAGINADTTAAASAMLAEIESALADEGAQMRYPAAFYLAFRAGMLARIVQSSDSTDGVIGQLAVPYVYFTNAMDDNGTHHPFMIIATYGLPDSLSLLWDVPKPPGGDCDNGTCDPTDYNTQPVTRSYHREAFLIKIPLRDYGEVSTLTENIMVGDLASDVGVTALDHHNYASVSATGVAIDGVIIYPTYNNSLHVSQSAAELSAHGMHSGRGLGVHYHADAYSGTHDGLNLYNDVDYIGRTHPPIISIGFDGVAGYGIYRAGDSSSEGVAIALDDFGGHAHGQYGYHYHAFTAAEIAEGMGPQAQQVPYTAHKLPPLGAWSGRINDIPEFWKGPAPDYNGARSRYLGNEE